MALALAGSALVAGSATAAPSAAPAALTLAPAAAAAPSAAARKVVRVPYGMVGVAIGTRVLGGDIPASSSQTGAQVLSCTNKANISGRNAVAAVNVPGLGTVRGVSSRTWTTKRGKTVNSYAQHSVARVTLVDSPLGTLDIAGVSARSHTWHDGKRFRAATTSEIASIRFTPPVGPAVNIPVPSPGDTITVPGLARISIGQPRTRVTRNGSSAEVSAINIAVYPTNTRVVIAQTKSKMNAGIRRGLFGGNAIGLQGTALADLVELGKTPIVNMPCDGTKGKVRTESVAGINLPGLLEVGALESGVFGKQGTDRRPSVAQGAARVARVSLLGGRVVINGINGVARVNRLPGNRLTRSTAGTGIGELVVDGEATELPLDGLEIPGLLKLESKIVQNTKNGVNVVGLRVTLLDGTGATIDLGKVSLGIRVAKPNKGR
ncbi:choice-of-anchor P family protein [Nocardioides nanhaiensis]|uniref:DUF5666 domain-containing protein n=1 Tax=Nocardioides nanhaiensis TaxID=1476871 RepID=A0ABP8VS46_9ACTN